MVVKRGPSATDTPALIPNNVHTSLLTAALCFLARSETAHSLSVRDWLINQDMATQWNSMQLKKE